MRTRAGWILALALAVPGIARAQESLVDPRVTITADDEQLKDVLGELTDQTGVAFHTGNPMQFAVQQARLAAGAPAPEQADDALNPKVSLDVTDEPLRAVLHRLEQTAPLYFQPLGLTAYQVMPGSPPADDAAGPQVEAGEYDLVLTGLRAERVRGRYWGWQQAQEQTSRLQAFLEVRSRTNLAWLALRGVGEGFTAALDEQPLELISTEPNGMPFQAPDRLYRVLNFRLPEADGERVTALAGDIKVRDDVTEQVFEFDDLTAADQTQTEGELDVTLKSFEKVEGGARNGRLRFAGAGGEGYQAQIVISRPLTDGLKEMMRPTMPGMGLPQIAMAGFPGAPALVDVPMLNWNGNAFGAGGAANLPNVMVQQGPNGEMQVEVQVQHDGNVQQRRVIVRRGEVVEERMLGVPPQPPGAPGQPGIAAQPLAGGQGAVVQIPQAARQALQNLGFDPFMMATGGWNPTLPLATYEAGGVRRAGQIIDQRMDTEGDELLVQTVTMFFPVTELDPEVLWISVVEYGDTESSVPFSFEPIELPAGG